MKEIKRIDEIDLLKGIGIIFMITGHIEFGTIYDKWIHSFHMPMFYIISGFLFYAKDTQILNYMKRKSKSLLTPYFVFSILHYLLWILICFFKNDISLLNLLNPIKHIFFINTSGMPISGALWFLTSLLIVEIIYFILFKFFSVYKRRIIIIIFSVLGCIIPKYFRLPFAMDTSLMGLGLFEIGYTLKKENLTIDNKYFPFFIIFIGSIICFINGYVNVRNGEYANIILYYICAVLMTIGLFYICKFWVKSKFIKKELRFIGMNSIVYVCLNQLVLFVPNKIVLIFKNFYILFGLKIVIFIFSMIVLHFSVIFIKKNCKWILGK